MDFDASGFGAKTNPVKTPIRHRNYKKPDPVKSEAKAEAPTKKPTLSETKVTGKGVTHRPTMVSKNPKQARGDSANKHEALQTEKDVVSDKTEVVQKEKDLNGSEGETDFKDRETAPPKREADYYGTAGAAEKDGKEEGHRGPIGHSANEVHRQPDVKALRPKALVKELPPLPSSYSSPLPPSYSPSLSPSYSSPLPPSYKPPSFSEPLSPSYPPLSYSQPLPPSYHTPSPPSYSQPLPPSYHTPSPPSYNQPFLPSYSQPLKPSSAPITSHNPPNTNHLDPINGVFVEASSLSSAPYLYINKVTSPNVPKIPKSVPYPFVKPAAPPLPLTPDSSTAPYRSKLEDFTLPAGGHLSQKRHTMPATDINDINRMDSTGLAVSGKYVSMNGNTSTPPPLDDQQEEGVEGGRQGSIPRPPGTPRPQDAEDSHGEADTFSR